MNISKVARHRAQYTAFKSKKFFPLLGFTILAYLFVSPQTLALDTNKLIPLVGNKVPTLIDTADNPARAQALVQAILAEHKVSITATTQAWSGSGLRSGKFVGRIDHYSLNNERNNYVYSEPYMTLPLHIASKANHKLDVTRLDLIYRKSVGIENRFANTDTFRAERSVRWARSPDFIGLIQQLVDQRTDFILADKFMLDQVNKMLVAANEKPLYISSAPIQLVQVQLAINADYPNAQSLINEFNRGIADLKDSGEYESYLTLSSNTASLLDEALYEDIIRKW